ncbi:MAG: cadherin domain-containing protein [Planctomycetota bacterium]
MTRKKSAGWKANRHGMTRPRVLQCEQLEARRVLAAAINDPYWESVSASDVDFSSGDSVVKALEFDLFSLRSAEFVASLADVPAEFTVADSELPVVTLPRPDGSGERFRIASTQVMAPELAAKYPSFQSFIGQGVDDPTASLRFDITHLGLNASVLSARGGYVIEPYFIGDASLYASHFFANEFDTSDWEPETDPAPPADEGQTQNDGDDTSSSEQSNMADSQTAYRQTGDEIIVYQTAFAATAELVGVFGGTKADGVARMVTELNRMNSAYEVEFAVRFELVANNDQLVYTDANTDPYTNGNNFAMFAENQTNLDTLVGDANYDIGHVFATGGGGLARLRSAGRPGIKAYGVSANVNSQITPKHEFGHQFGSPHTWNGLGGACGTQQWGASGAVEPGSGSTILSYAGFCGDQNIQNFRDPYFNVHSFEIMRDHMENAIPNVGQRIVSGNDVPTAYAGEDKAIPANTPFVLTAVGSDPDADDVLTYSFEQRDLGPQQDVNAGDNGSSPLFRSFPATENPNRFFPQVSDLVNNQKTRGETLPTTERELNFTATVRDNRVGSGGIALDHITLMVYDTGAPFQVTSFDTATTLDGFTRETITWDVADTHIAPIDAEFVSIWFSTDGGQSYPIEVANRLPNSGSAAIVVPNVNTTEGRFMVRGYDNVFFDINDANIEVIQAPVDLDLGSVTSTYIENAAPVAVAPEATLEFPSYLSLDVVSIDISLQNPVAGDRLSVASSGDVSVIGNVLRYSSTVIGTVTGSNTQIRVSFSSSATTSMVQEVLRAVRFQNTTDNPTAITRNVEFSVGNNLNESTIVEVVPVNDSPVLGNALLTSILEDTVVQTGDTVESILENSFSDVDEGSFATGIAVVRNLEDPAEGLWHYSTNNGVTWNPMGMIFSSSESLVLGLDAMLGFAPSPDFEGQPRPLGVRALDNTYAGQFTQTIPVALDAVYTELNGAASANIADFGIQVINVNDAPVANVPLYEFEFYQDEFVDVAFPLSAFTDIDDAQLSWELTGRLGRRLPDWIEFEAATRRMMGLPENRDVGDYQLDLIVKDTLGATATIPVDVTILNVNDAPTEVTLSTREIPENVFGRSVGRVGAQDPDVEDELTWTLSDLRFEVIDQELHLLEPLDFEQEQMLTLQLTVTDNGTPPLSTSISIGIDVLNENEFLPEVEPMDFELDSGTPSGTLIVDVDAIDNDFGDQISYQLKGDDAGAFMINESTGEVWLAEDLDYTQKDHYRIFIESSDDGTPVNSSLVQFNLRVVPLNNHAPFMANPQVFEVNENSPAGTVVGTVQASDADGNVLAYEIVGESPFVIDEATGELQVAEGSTLDFEDQSSYEFLTRVTEDVEPNRNAISTITVNVTNVNDAPTEVQLDAASVPAFRRGIVLGNLVVTDQDLVETAYTFSTTDPRFEIDGDQLRLMDQAFFTSSDVGTVEVDFLVTDTNDPSVQRVLPLRIDVLSASPWTNLENSLDVNRDGVFSSVDALELIYDLNTRGARLLSNPRSLMDQLELDWDVNGDGSITALDALLAIERLNRRAAGEGEAPAAAESQADWLQAYEDLEEERRRRWDA